jgi:hypothetical protein
MAGFTVDRSAFRNNMANCGAAIAAWSAWSAWPDVVDVVNCTIAFNRGKKYVGVNDGFD